MQIETRRVHRNWIEKLLLFWGHAYETKMLRPGHEVTGRGRTPKGSKKAAIRKWNEETVRLQLIKRIAANGARSE
jgi:hypothetical protein